MELSFTQDEKVCLVVILRIERWEVPILIFVLQRFVLAEIIKSSTVKIDLLLAFINTNRVDPDWMRMQLPLGMRITLIIQQPSTGFLNNI